MDLSDRGCLHRDRTGIISGGLKLFTHDVFVDGDTAIVELYTQATAKSGVQFNNEYCWICQFYDQQILEVRAYLDSALVTKVIETGITDVR